MQHDLNIRSNRFDDPNLELITKFFRTEFPELTGGNTESMVAAIADKMIGSRNYRLAGRPEPESEVAIREVIRMAVEAGKPVPVLIVGGPKKPSLHESVDVAELAALRILGCVQRQVQEFYGTGLDIRIRLEDATGYFLEGTAPEMVRTMETYTNDFATLIRVLGYDNFITPIRETEIIDPNVLADHALILYPLFLDYLKESALTPPDKWAELFSYTRLVANGWQGLIPQEMRDYYEYRYSHLFPTYTPLQKLEVVAKYLAITLARHKVKALGLDPAWNGKFIQISFAPPVVGEPKGRISTRLYYRSIPLSHSKKHIPYWRAKGILKLNGLARISLATWGEKLDLTPFEVELSRGADKVTIKADYLIETENNHE